MIILGIDPGTTRIGYALLEPTPRGPQLLEAGLLEIRSPRGEKRLIDIYKKTGKLIRRWRPTILAVERLFFAKNQKTALEVSEARGVILLTASLAGLKLFDYTPLEIKKTVTGDGGADKSQLKKMVQLTLPETRNLKGGDDVFDAVATALACYYKGCHHPIGTSGPGT